MRLPHGALLASGLSLGSVRDPQQLAFRGGEHTAEAVGSVG